MPYFYHLTFELYPYGSSSAAERINREQGGGIWVPASDSDIFGNEEWPVSDTVEPPSGSSGSSRNRNCYRASGVEEGGSGSGSGRGGVIDCGPKRALALTCNSSGSGPGLEELVAKKKAVGIEGPGKPLLGGNRDLRTAERDWRFGRVRVESLDLDTGKDMDGEMVVEKGKGGEKGESSMNGHGHRPGHRRGESSSAVQQDGINAGLAAGGIGRVTKARIQRLGWGVVHLYRDGEETPGLGMGVEVYTAGEKEGEGVEDCTTLCIPAVPGYFTASDFLGFVGEKTRKMVSHFRMVMTGRMNRYLVLMKFRDSGEAARWRSDFDGKPFNSMEPETCHVTFIKSITFQTPNSRPNTSFPELSHDPFTPSTSSFLKPFPPPTPNLVELPTCPVCLERMDDTTGLLTILCQHVFHCACLQKWKGSGCPVCRHTNPSLSTPPNTAYDPSNPPFGSGEASLCSVCDCTDDLWICLICGAVGCGRYKGGHAKEHWKDSAHNFALEIETQHVWDYADDMWVHRLIRDKGDGKVVDVGRERDGSGRGGMDMVPAEKLERIGMEYTHLLSSQLESQRVYFEELVGKAVAKASAASLAASSASTRADSAMSQLATLESENKKLREDVVVALEKDLAREKKKAERSAEVARGFGKSLVEEKKVSEGLMERIGHVNKSMMEISSQLTSLKEENADLAEQNRDLLFSITAQDKLKDMVGVQGDGLEEGEVEGGMLSLPPQQAEGKGRRKGKGRVK
ncbi:RING finger ETP1-like protein [Lachnellula hyalina]|uniref:RING finger ETP1-like protein n=1 Tax=Lachnellula hyalina TaxID=1316788 RepID=A0A8H8TXY1_9HELO|nr:RING finger ETP1-like protein [Lachnellula hyalina]TVY24790.1 RING finger ETP1-like protein [Lachnellula hyalina]